MTIEHVPGRNVGDMPERSVSRKLPAPEVTRARKEDMEMRRELVEMPFDMDFGGELCHATGDEVCLGDPSNPADWWNEYIDQDGNLHYGR